MVPIRLGSRDSTFETLPLTLNVFVPSYSVENEWWAIAGQLQDRENVAVRHRE